MTSLSSVLQFPPGRHALQHDPPSTRASWITAFHVTVALAAFAAAIGWFVGGFYAADGATLEAKGRYADLVILVGIVPLALVAPALERKGQLCGRAVMVGLAAYLGFMHGVLAFNYDENTLFVIYATMVGLCSVLCVTGLADLAQSVPGPATGPAIRLASVGLLVAVLAGYGYWVGDVVAALVNDTDAGSLSGTGLPANAARVLDMAVMLPLTGYGAIGLWVRRRDGLAISAVMSTFLILIGATVIVMEVGLASATDQDLDIGKIAGFGATITLSLVAAIITHHALGRSARPLRER